MSRDDITIYHTDTGEEFTGVKEFKLRVDKSIQMQQEREFFNKVNAKLSEYLGKIRCIKELSKLADEINAMIPEYRASVLYPTDIEVQVITKLPNGNSIDVILMVKGLYYSSTL